MNLNLTILIFPHILDRFFWFLSSSILFLLVINFSIIVVAIFFPPYYGLEENQKPKMSFIHLGSFLPPSVTSAEQITAALRNLASGRLLYIRSYLYWMEETGGGGAGVGVWVLCCAVLFCDEPSLHQMGSVL